ncbi:type IV pili methyl-accepting chemotaxis transducer N-terminal domain-containing protein [Crenobacter sp. SG2305]|uniref:type IV pili methyl-accepting chemotaxis transducer N-terminal domain-containing protein n=1 Tax=Crenobacter oryzisoli TaxID=3056844 RepID=UPI0025AB25AF|nr:type IV pili methyl-accepting chemotaxis transducer N-terminal domain-containing protein [Crenobacter sp. SG2305]MDN0082552.1 type IV pili methyl-accepting chemotaxis transducer N-terminal domain-containing protein [Crenobacter sp. SG2305]
MKLSTKIVGALVGFLLLALLAIGSTLLLSWQLEGTGAAINDAGSLRMRTTQVALDLTRHVDGQLPVATVRTDLRNYDTILARLRHGDPARPLSLPQQSEVYAALSAIEQDWQLRLKPQADALLVAPSSEQRLLLSRYQVDASAFLPTIDHFVQLLEENNAHKTEYLRICQVLLATMAILGTVALIYLMVLIVLRPLDHIHQAIRRLTAGDYSATVPVETNDEFGQVGAGFNQMARRLAEVHATLEERVQEKTASLEQKNRELALLLEIATFLNQAQTLEELCRGFLTRVVDNLGAAGGAVRLLDGEHELVYLVADAGLPETLLGGEQCLSYGDCFCSLNPESLHSRQMTLPDDSALPCKQEGFKVVSTFPIALQQRSIGLFNLHFREATVFTPQKTRLMETLGQHLASAIENQRLVDKERELAILEERNLMAQGLHDSIAQGLSFLNLQVQVLEQAVAADDGLLRDDTIALLRTGVQESYDDVRELLNNFRSRLSARLPQAVETVLDKFRRQTGLKVELQSEGLSRPLLPEQQLQLLFILQEALSNVRKHAQASQVLVRLDDSGEALTLTIMDDGIGFDAERMCERDDTHYGLAIMAERATRAGVTMRIDSEPGEGCCIRLSIARAQRQAA